MKFYDNLGTVLRRNEVVTFIQNLQKERQTEPNFNGDNRVGQRLGDRSGRFDQLLILDVAFGPGFSLQVLASLRAFGFMIQRGSIRPNQRTEMPSGK